MHELSESPAIAAPKIDLHMVSQIDAQALDQIQAQVLAFFTERLMARHKRWTFERKGLFAPRVLKWLVVAGLLVSMALAALGGAPYRGVRLEWCFAAFFTLAGLLVWFPPRPWNWYRYYQTLAQMHIRPMFRQARKRLPFTAEYELRGGLAVYFRTSGAGTELVWHNRLHGVSVTGNGFTLLFKNARSQSPHAFFLHAPSAEFTALLARHGVVPMPPA